MNSLEANIRDNKSKGQLNAIRNNGSVPAIIYGGKVENKDEIEDYEEIEKYKKGGSVKSNMKCNKPQPSTRKDKNSMVKACKNNEEKLIHYGDPNMTIKKHIPERRANFNARHRCKTEPPSKMTARYWSCKKW